MGRELLDGDLTFRSCLTELDRVVVRETGESVLGRIYDGRFRKSDPFTALRFTHPAIFMLEVAQAKVMMACGIRPHLLLGASLGEFTVAALAGVIPVETAATLLVRQAQIFEKTCSGGGMLVVHASPSLFYKLPFLHDRLELAGVDCDSHFTVAGPEKSIADAVVLLEGEAILCQRIPVPAAFHSRWIEQAKDACDALMTGIELQEPKIPIISCADVAVRERYTPEAFWRTARQPVEFAKTIRMLENRGEYIYLDLGPSGALSNAVKRNLPTSSRSRAFPLLSPFGRDLELHAEVKSFYEGSRSGRGARQIKVYGFPGQGSQVKGMGAGLFKEYKDLVAAADRVLGYSVEELIVADPGGKLRQTEYTQPALYVVEALSYLEKVQQDPAPADYLLGHSLGEYVALFAAEVFDFEVGLRLVRQRGKLMGQILGGMAAVVDCELPRLQEILSRNGLDALEIANYNTPSQFILAGRKEDIERAEPFFDGGRTRYLPLNVSAPFHSSYMMGVATEFRRFLDGFDLAPPKIPVIANVDARPYRTDQIRENLVRQIAHPVRWLDSVGYLMEQGNVVFEELGPGKVLTKFVETIRAQMRSSPVATTASEFAFGEMTRREPSVPCDASTGGAAANNQPVSQRHEAVRGVPEIKAKPAITGAAIGAQTFRDRYGLRYAYVAGSMCRGISGKDLVVRLGRAGLMGNLGSSGVDLADLESEIRAVQAELGGDRSFGVNVLHDAYRPEREVGLVRSLQRQGVSQIEASGFLAITPALIEHRLKGLKIGAAGQALPAGRILAKVSRREVAEAFLGPAPERLVRSLVQQGILTPQEAELSAGVAMADDLCVESETGWQYTTNNVVSVLPHVLRLRDEMSRVHGYGARIHVGAAGGIGTPEAAAAAVVAGADFVLTGSINQCTVEARTSSTVKDMLEQAGLQDIDYAPFGEISELGVRVQVFKKGVFFPARAKRLYDLWRYHDSFSDIDLKVQKDIEEKYLQRGFNDAYAEITTALDPGDRAKADADPKYKMALVFGSYLNHGLMRALAGDARQRIDFHIPCGPALGDFNQWVRGTSLKSWRERHVDAIGIHLMEETASLLCERFNAYAGGRAKDASSSGAFLEVRDGAQASKRQ